MNLMEAWVKILCDTSGWTLGLTVSAEKCPPALVAR